MSYFWFLLAFLLGITAGAYLVIPPLIIVFFGIPFSLRLRARGMLRDLRPISRYLGSLAVLGVLLIAATYGVYRWLPEYVSGYWIGVGLTVLRGISQCGQNANNLSDYIESNNASLDLEKLKPPNSLIT
jgi:hypothetical protein